MSQRSGDLLLEVLDGMGEGYGLGVRTPSRKTVLTIDSNTQPLGLKAINNIATPFYRDNIMRARIAKRQKARAYLHHDGFNQKMSIFSSIFSQKYLVLVI